MEEQLLQVVSCQRRQGDDPLGHPLPEEWQVDPGLSQVKLIPNDNTRPLRQAFLIGLQFMFQVLQLDPRLGHREIHHVQEEAAALDVLQEGRPQPTVLMGTFDEARNVSNCNRNFTVNPAGPIKTPAKKSPQSFTGQCQYL